MAQITITLDVDTVRLLQALLDATKPQHKAYIKFGPVSEQEKKQA